MWWCTWSCPAHLPSGSVQQNGVEHGLRDLLYLARRHRLSRTRRSRKKEEGEERKAVANSTDKIPVVIHSPAPNYELLCSSSQQLMEAFFTHSLIFLPISFNYNATSAAATIRIVSLRNGLISVWSAKCDKNERSNFKALLDSQNSIVDVNFSNVDVIFSIINAVLECRSRAFDLVIDLEIAITKSIAKSIIKSIIKSIARSIIKSVTKSITKSMIKTIMLIDH